MTEEIDPTTTQNGGDVNTGELIEDIGNVVEPLNPKQERFCQLYATDKEFFGNGVQTYIEVYDLDKSKPNWYKVACSDASQLLTNTKVCKRINELLEAGGLNDQFIDKQLGFLITQHSDFTNKLGAIKEYNKLKQRITDKLEHSGEVAMSWKQK